MIRTGIFELNGISAIGIAGHPEGHPSVNRAGLWQWMENKMAEIASRGMAPQAYQGGKTAAPCILRLIVDGMAMPAGSSIDNITPNEVAGMEIYPGAASTPVELAHYQEDSWCGAILVWTKGG